MRNLKDIVLEGKTMVLEGKPNSKRAQFFIKSLEKENKEKITYLEDQVDLVKFVVSWFEDNEFTDAIAAFNAQSHNEIEIKKTNNQHTGNEDITIYFSLTEINDSRELNRKDVADICKIVDKKFGNMAHISKAEFSSYLTMGDCIHVSIEEE